MAEWKFRRMDKGEKLKDPTETEFFTTEDIGGISAALVRESIQNTMDARVSKEEPVKIRFALSGEAKAANLSDIKEYVNGLQQHLYADNNGLRNKDLFSFEDPFPYLLIEDFNTEGLEGDPLEYEDPPKEDDDKHNFFWFWRNVGRSGKAGQDRGRWGIGKTVFPATSLVNTFFGLSVRRSDQKALLMGESILKIHKIEGEPKRIYPYGNYGLFEDEDEYFASPVVSKDEISKFISSFNLKRSLEGENNSGLSIIIPFPSNEVNSNDIIKSVVIQYFYAILAGDLIVTVVDNKEFNININSHNIESILNRIHFSEGEDWNKENLSKLYNFSKWALDLDDNEFIKLNTPPSVNYSPQWRKSWYVNDQINEALEKRVEDFDSGDRIAFKIPVKVHEINKNPQFAWFKVFLEKDETLSNSESQIIRDGITITGIKPTSKKDLRALLVIDDLLLTNLLGDAENPAHTEWQINSRNFKGKYKEGDKVISFVTRSLDILYGWLLKPSEGIDRDSLKDIFHIGIGEQEFESDSIDENKVEEGTTDPPTPPASSKPRAILVNQLEDGFKLIPGNADSFPEESEVRIAYRIPNKNPLKKYKPEDFDLTNHDIAIQSWGVDILNKTNNGLLFSVKNPDFEVKFTGFDPNRDLYIKVS